MSSPSVASHNRIYGLDIVRAFAILTVVYTHGLYILPNHFLGIAGIFDFDGVSVFFVLSGFLIGKILINTLEKEGGRPAALFDFMYKRWLRTLPPYYLIFGFLAIYYVITEDLNLVLIKRYLVFMQNFNTPPSFFFPESWSLAVEEWFYLLVPFLAFSLVNLGKLKPKPAILLVTITIFILIPWVRYVKSTPVTSLADWDNFIRKQVVTRLDSIVFGLLGAYTSYYYQAFWVKYKKLGFVVGMLLFLAVRYSFTPYLYDFLGLHGLYFSVFSFNLTSLSVLMTLPFLSNLKQGSGSVYKVLTFFSLISYSMYLLHLSVVQYILLPLTEKHLPIFTSPYLKYGLYWFYTVSLAFLMYTFFEKPVMKLRNKLSIKKKAKVITVPESRLSL